jgi:hypothetical protein
MTVPRGDVSAQVPVISLKRCDTTILLTLGCATAFYVRAQSTAQCTAATLPTSDPLSEPGIQFPCGRQ